MSSAPSSELERQNFFRVMLLNAAAKELIARSYRVNLLALDAMVQSKRGDSSLRGFDEVSSQMRSWSRDLHRELEQLGSISRLAVTRASTSCKQRHLLGLLARAATQSGHALVTRVHEQKLAEQEARDAEMARGWRQVNDALSDLNMLGMMAVVLSRSAMIEASGGSPEQRAQLSDVSQEFYRNSDAVINVLKDLTRAMTRDYER
jgi:hypothetical protein